MLLESFPESFPRTRFGSPEIDRASENCYSFRRNSGPRSFKNWILGIQRFNRSRPSENCYNFRRNSDLKLAGPKKFLMHNIFYLYLIFRIKHIVYFCGGKVGEEGRE